MTLMEYVTGDTDADGMCPNVAEITVVNLDQWWR